ncbi:MAG: hypothetical protein WC703_09215 [Candidatus Neomarinimicrobiota bacterium]
MMQSAFAYFAVIVSAAMLLLISLMVALKFSRYKKDPGKNCGDCACSGETCERSCHRQ